jgi:hypothetical protein
LNVAAAAAQVSPFETSSPWNEVTQIYRRVCVLRSQGRGGEAAQLYAGKFSEALDVIEQFAGAGPGTEARLQALLAAEDERIATVSALAELLTPLLVERLREIFPINGPQSTPEKFPGGKVSSENAAFSPDKPDPASAPSVADLIEGMLAQERAAAPRDAQRAS